ncbi:hypothetical protein ACOME3_009923 [Neoechinorhynchus agilis]
MDASRNVENEIQMMSFTIEADRLIEMSNRQRQLRYGSCIHDFKIRVKRSLCSGNLKLDLFGKLEDLKRGRKYLLCELAKPESVAIPESIPAYIAESSFKPKLKDLEDEYGCSLNFVLDGRVVLVNSPSYNKIVFEKLNSMIAQESMFCDEVIEVKNALVAWINGPFGKTKKEIVSSTGLSHLTLNSVEGGKIIVRGDEKSRESAKKVIQEITDKYKSYLISALRLTEPQLEYLFKNQSNVVDHILEQCDVNIQFDFVKNGLKSASLVHKDNESFEKAKKAIIEMAEKIESETIPVRPGYSQYFAKVAMLRQQRPNGFEFHVASDRAVTMKGPACDMRRCKTKALAYFKVIGQTLSISQIAMEPETRPMFVDENNLFIGKYGKFSDCYGWYEYKSKKLKIIGPYQSLHVLMRDLKGDARRTQFATELNLDPVNYPQLIGHRGANVQRLREQYKVNVIVPSRSDPPTAKVIVLGEKANVELCRDRILASIENKPGNVVKQSLAVPKCFRGAVIGPNGITIRAIREHTHVTIKVPLADEPDGEPVVIQGTIDNVKAAVIRIEEILSTLKIRALEIPVNRLNYFVNRQQRIKSLFLGNQSGLRVESTEVRNKFIVHGPGDAVDRFMLNIEKEIDKTKQQPESITNQRQRLDNTGVRSGEDEHGLVFRPSTIGAVRRQPGRRYIRGTIVKHFIINSQTIPRLIGRQGTAINHFQYEHNVRVRFGAFEDRPEVVEVSGYSMEQVELAIEDLIALSINMERNTFISFNQIMNSTVQREVSTSAAAAQIPNINTMDDFPQLSNV